MEAQLLTAEELAVILNVDVHWVWRATREKKIPFYRVGKYLRFDLALVLEALNGIPRLPDHNSRKEDVA
jgi:excisionase family DNA binding protein